MQIKAALFFALIVATGANLLRASTETKETASKRRSCHAGMQQCAACDEDNQVKIRTCAADGSAFGDWGECADGSCTGYSTIWDDGAAVLLQKPRTTREMQKAQSKKAMLAEATKEARRHANREAMFHKKAKAALLSQKPKTLEARKEEEAKAFRKAAATLDAKTAKISHKKAKAAVLLRKPPSHKPAAVKKAKVQHKKAKVVKATKVPKKGRSDYFHTVHGVQKPQMMKPQDKVEEEARLQAAAKIPTAAEKQDVHSAVKEVTVAATKVVKAAPKKGRSNYFHVAHGVQKPLHNKKAKAHHKKAALLAQKPKTLEAKKGRTSGCLPEGHGTRSTLEKEG